MRAKRDCDLAERLGSLSNFLCLGAIHIAVRAKKDGAFASGKDRPASAAHFPCLDGSEPS